MKQEKKDKPGILYLVATPIGNLDDITLRALKTFKEVDIIAAEDTRRTRKLLSFYDIHTPLISFREHNKVYQGEKIIQRLKNGENIAICSDAGMPIISDPGEDFVKLCIEEKITVTVVPGANAALSALVLSGINANTFLYLGFIPRKSKKRNELLKDISIMPHTLIFYESPFRVLDLLKDLYNFMGDRKACVIREITKFHEEALRGTLSELIEKMSKKKYKGEFTIILEGTQINNKDEYFDTKIALKETKELMNKGMPRKKATKEIARKYNTSARAIYQLLIDAGI